LDVAAALANVDLPYITELVTRSGIAVAMKVPKLMAEYKSYMSGTHKNYYQGGIVMGTLMKYFTDVNLNN
jgi:hypothetical protein